MNYAIGVFGKDDHLVLRLLTQLAHPARPAGGCASHCLLVVLSPICSSEGQHDQCEHNAHPQVIKAGYIPVPPLLHVLHDLVPSASHGPPSAAECLSATMKCGSTSRPQVMVEVGGIIKKELSNAEKMFISFAPHHVY